MSYWKSYVEAEHLCEIIFVSDFLWRLSVSRRLASESYC